VLLRHLMAEQRKLSSDDIAKDMANENLAFVSMLRNKLADEIVGRLSELAEPKVGLNSRAKQRYPKPINSQGLVLGASWDDLLNRKGSQVRPASL
jgi:hypothetical protein